MKRSLLLFSLLILAITLAGLVTGCGAAKPPSASIMSPNDKASVTGLNQPVAFKGMAQDDKGKEITGAKYEWDFGDQSTKSTDQNPSHQYKQPGTYTVTLTVRGPKDSATSTAKPEQKKQISITVNNAPPTAKATATPPSGDAPLAVQFDGSGSTDADGTISKYDWDFGDGAKGTGAKASHDFAKPGTYTVTLTVTDNFNATAKATVTVTVKQPAVSENPAGQGKIWEIQMGTKDGKNVFDPAVVTVQPGDTIRWINNGVHSATAYCPQNQGKKLGIPAAAASTSLCFDTKLLSEPGKTYELKVPADAPQGTYAYYCQPHESLGMVGLIIIGKPSDLGQAFLSSLAAPVQAAFQNLLKMVK
jgi:plastocyanin